MHFTIEKMISGEAEVVEWYSTAKSLWDEILEQKEAESVKGLAKIITSKQPLFEDQCGGRWIGQEIMAVVGIAQFYTTTDGFTSLKQAKRVYEAFNESGCSIEVIGHAEAIAQQYALNEE